ITITGKKEKLALHTKGKSVFGMNNVGPYSEWIIQNTCTQAELEQMKLDGIAIASVSANDAYIALTDQPKGGIDDVFE
ncbi:hypothetical protein J4G37_39620, partial [Microvirga sp. 3-52]|nr:hypothetical protein [Microvirga sp. 3-52]